MYQGPTEMISFSDLGHLAVAAVIIVVLYQAAIGFGWITHREVKK